MATCTTAPQDTGEGQPDGPLLTVAKYAASRPDTALGASTGPQRAGSKFKAGRRTIGLSSRLVALLRAHSAEQERALVLARLLNGHEWDGWAEA